MVRTYVVVRHSGQNWYWGILKRRLLGVQLARPQTSGQRGEKKVSPLLDYGDTFSPLIKKMAYNFKRNFRVHALFIFHSYFSLICYKAELPKGL